VSAILIFALLIGFSMALAIGANDVANSMATAVGAKAITPKQAVLIAGVLEFIGATFFGKQVTETIRKGILHLDVLADPKIVIWGSISALIGATIWLAIATYKSWPVSTTHSIVGGMVGWYCCWRFSSCKLVKNNYYYFKLGYFTIGRFSCILHYV